MTSVKNHSPRKVTVGPPLILLGIVIVATLLVSAVAAQPATPASSRQGGSDVSNQRQLSSRDVDADDGTARVDPLDGFNKYRGGFDITNKHYWTSTAFTGICGYAIAAFWLLAALSYGAFKLIVALLGCKCRPRIERHELDRTVNESNKLQPNPLRNRNSTISGHSVLVALLLVALFAIIVASGVAIGGSVKFHDKARKAVDIIIDTADDASGTIYNATSAMTGISRTLVVTAGDQSPTAVAAASASVFLASTSRRLDAEAASIQKEARDNERLIRLALTVVYVITVVAVSVNLAAALALSVCGILRIRKAISWLFWLGWLLMVISWVLFGIYYFLQNFAKDTCNALEKFEQDPYSSTLSSLVPCDALESAKPILNEVSEGIYDIVSRINDAVSSVPSSITNNVQICSPFSPPPNYRYRAYNADNCPPSSIPIGGIPKLLEQYLSETDYRVVEGYASSIQSLVDAYPGMESLAECESVRVSLSRIVSRYCRPLKKNVAISWAALVALSSLDLVLLLLVVVGKRMAYSSRNTAVEDHESAAEFPPAAGLRRSSSSVEEKSAVG